MSNQVAIIFIHGIKDNLTAINYQSILDHSEGCDVYTSSQHDYLNYYYDFLGRKHISEWSGKEMWWCCDNLFLYWYLSNPKKRYKQYIIIEHDTYANANILDFLNVDSATINNHNGVMSAQTLTYDQRKDYHWFQQFSSNPIIKNIYGIYELTSCSPICCMMLSDEAVVEIIDNIKKYPQINNVFSEIKYGTILSSCKNYGLSTFNNPNLMSPINKHITYEPEYCLNTLKQYKDSNILNQGIFHPIKKVNELYEYFNCLNIDFDKNNISQALYGISLDAKSVIEKAYQEGITEIKVDNDLCSDPAEGIPKTLRIVYVKNNQKYVKYYQEGETLDIKQL